MSASEKDLVLARREGAVRACAYFRVFEPSVEGAARRDEFAANLFPLPTVTVLRIEEDPHGAGFWKVDVPKDATGTTARGGPRVLYNPMARGAAKELWTDDFLMAGVEVTRERALLWADLLNRPTEEQEDLDYYNNRWPADPRGVR